MRRGFPTPASASRALGAPVLAVIPRTRAPKPRKVKTPKPEAPPRAEGKPKLEVVKGGA
jgi:hypothetical protein